MAQKRSWRNPAKYNASPFDVPMVTWPSNCTKLRDPYIINKLRAHAEILTQTRLAPINQDTCIKTHRMKKCLQSSPSIQLTTMLNRTMLHILAISSDSLVDIIIFIPLLAVFPTIVDAPIIKPRDRLNDWEKKRYSDTYGARRQAHKAGYESKAVALISCMGLWSAWASVAPWAIEMLSGIKRQQRLISHWVASSGCCNVSIDISQTAAVPTRARGNVQF
ncbi:hypothetical protein B0H14DRAFT_2571209 [Mycena olivaceomarginata]|nr:hypothetical protein B0H14DRAFT_2571209 [Mycena olivaceomarginata]